ncbi:hypothetical protein V6N11_012657 [Hibiscus sabdariffa]|uniref:Uncharacterized protein n=2 Tax=Hibiscus sabdariffa TaxID=183260 RepID=A0ABR2AI56_9ROSI
MIDTQISVNNGSPWFCSFLYGPPHREKKKEFWKSITRLRNDESSLWCLMGDSNIIANQTEKTGGNFYDLSQANWFNNAINKCGLLEMPIKGGSYTWSNQCTDDDAIMEKLDRILFNINWNDMFKRAAEVMEPTIGLDHSPIICLLNEVNRKPRKEFKFESKWLREDDCTYTIKQSWNQRATLQEYLFSKASDYAFSEFSSVVLSSPSSQSTRPLNESVWSPPPNELIKANCDASWISCSQIAAKAEVVLSCLIYAESKGFKKIIVEYDNKSLIHRLNNRLFSVWEFASIE